MIRQIILLTLTLSGLGACTTTPDILATPIATVTLRSADGLPTGTAALTATGTQLTLSLAATGLPEGAHGLHLHMSGNCAGPGFASAGGHLNPAGHQHGTSNPAGSHLGDLPNLVINTKGAGALSVLLQASRAELEAALLDTDGTALVVHADPDDYKSEPSGNSGTRIACGVWQRR